MIPEQQLGTLKDNLVQNVLLLLTEFLASRENSTSRFDPKHSTEDGASELHEISQRLYLCHRLNNPNIETALMSTKFLDDYLKLLRGLLDLLFKDISSSMHLGLNLELTYFISKIYKHLCNTMDVVDDGKLNYVIQSFQLDFLERYNLLDQDKLFFNEVRDFQSHSLDLIAPPLFTLKDVSKRGLFKLSCEKLGYRNLLIEILQLSDGNVAIFKVNSQRPVLGSKEDAHEFLLELATHDNVFSLKLSNSYKLGRTLLFPTVRRRDLQIQEERGNSIKLGTKTGNNIILEITALDTVSWHLYWKVVLINLCTDSPSFALQEFKSVEQNLSSNLPLEHVDNTTYNKSLGLGLFLPFQNESKMSGLHKTKPLSRLNRFDPYLESLDSHFSIERDPCTKAENEISPSPSQLYPKSVLTEVRAKQLSPNLGRSSDDIESLLSANSSLPESQSNNCEQNRDDEDFILSTKSYQPQLSKKKPSSIFRFFKKDRRTAKSSQSSNSKELTTDATFNASTNGLTSLSMTPTTSTLSQLPELPLAATLPPNLKLDTSLTLLELKVKVSIWYGNSWKPLSPTWLTLKILNSNKDVEMLMIEDELCNTKCCIAITNNLNISRFTAQDIQIRFTNQGCIASVLPHNNNLLSIRSPKIGVLLNILNHCLNSKNVDMSTQEIPTSLTQMSIASNSSSILSTVRSSGKFSRSSTNSTSLSLSVSEFETNEMEECKCLLLLTKMKVRLHKFDENYGWKIDKIGLVDISSYEVRGLIKGCKFSFDEESFYSPFNDIKRIGRTGITIGERLLEFKKQNIADEVYKVIRNLDQN